MEIQGKIIKVLPEQTGEGKNGQWKKQDFIIETEEQYPKKICITDFNGKIDPAILVVENVLTVAVNIESKEFNERWFTNITAWKAELKGVAQKQTQEQQTYNAPKQPDPVFKTTEPVQAKDLPF